MQSSVSYIGSEAVLLFLFVLNILQSFLLPELKQLLTNC